MAELTRTQEAPATQWKAPEEPRNQAIHQKRIAEWEPYQRVLFRIAFIFFMVLSVPTTWKWVQRLFAIDVFNMNYRDLYEIADFSTTFLKINSESGRWGVASYVNWGIALLIALAGGALWTVLVRNRERKEYNTLYYWLRVVVRYRIAVGIISFGFVKLFPTQMPYPSVGVLNTNLADLLEQKIYWYSVGVVPGYQVFLGFIEILGGVLLFYRKTTAIGAALTAVVLFNIAFANHAYDGGVHLYSAYFVLLSLFLLVEELPVIWKLIVKEQDVVPVSHVPVSITNWQRYGLIGAKYSVIFVYVMLFFYIRYTNFFHETDPIKKEPSTPGLAGAKGLYNVAEFRLNGQSLPYSPLDSVRWQEASFEGWSTLTFKVARPVPIDLSNGGPKKKDLEKNFELSGVAGGRRFFYYEADTVNHILHLQDKNLAFAGNEEFAKKGGKAVDKTEKFTLHYSRPTASRIVLSGENEKKQAVYIVLDRVNKEYPLLKGRREELAIR